MKIITRALSVAALGVGLLTAAPPGPALADADGEVIPSVAAPGESVIFSIECEDTTATSATLFGAALGLSARIPMTQTRTDGTFEAAVNVPSGTMPGDYELSMECSDGSSTTAELTVVSRSGPHTGGGGLALAERRRAGPIDAGGGAGVGETVGWGLAGGVLLGGLAIAIVVRRRRDRAS